MLLILKKGWSENRSLVARGHAYENKISSYLIFCLGGTTDC